MEPNTIDITQLQWRNAFYNGPSTISDFDGNSTKMAGMSGYAGKHLLHPKKWLFLPHKFEANDGNIFIVWEDSLTFVVEEV